MKLNKPTAKARKPYKREMFGPGDKLGMHLCIPLDPASVDALRWRIFGQFAARCRKAKGECCCDEYTDAILRTIGIPKKGTK